MEDQGKIGFCFLLGFSLLFLAFLYINRTPEYTQSSLGIHPYDALVLSVLILTSLVFVVLGVEYLVRGPLSESSQFLRFPR